jgi:hypothetical protein
MNALLSSRATKLLFHVCLCMGCASRSPPPQAHHLILSETLVTADAGNLEVALPDINGSHAVGIVTTPDAWDELLENKLQTSLEFVTKHNSHKLTLKNAGSSGTWCDKIPGCRYLSSFSDNEPGTLRIVLPIKLKAMLASARSRVIVFKSPEQTVADHIFD